MRRASQRRDPLRLLGKRLGMLALLLLAVFGVRSVWEVYQKERAALELRRHAEGKLIDLTMRESALRADIAALKSERGLEAALRDEYGLGKEGENLIVIVEPSAREQPTDDIWLIRTLRRAVPW